MVHPKTTHALLFEEGDGYLLVRALQHGQKARSYVVRSLADGQLYVRKKLEADMVHMFPHNDIKFANHLPANDAPPMVHHTEYHHVADALIFKYCNGGDLRQLIDLHVARGETVPEDFVWHFLSRWCAIFTTLHYGLRRDGRRFDPLIHRDAWQGNFFLNWPTPPTEFPEILLGDWGSAQYVSDGDKGRGPTSVGNDVHSFAYVVLTLCLGKPLYTFGKVRQDEVLNLLPAQYSKELKNVAVELSALLVDGWPDFANWTGPDTAVLAQELIPVAEKMLKMPFSDLRWTIPQVTNQPALFDNEAALKEWCRLNNDDRNLTGKWSLVEVEKDTFRILRRPGRLNPAS